MTDFTNPLELTARYKEQVVPSVLPAQFAQALLPAKVSAVPIQLSFYFPPKPKKKPIELILDRLSEMDISGKEHLEEYLRQQYRRNFKFNTLRGNLTACQLFLSFLKDSWKDFP